MKPELKYEELLRILDYSYDEIFVTDAKGVLVYVNTACKRHYDQSSFDMIGKSSQEMTSQNLWGPRLSPLVLEYKERITWKQQSCTGVEMLTTASPVFNENGDVEYVIENVRNISKGNSIFDEEERSKKLFLEKEKQIEYVQKGEFEIENFVAKSERMREVIRSAWRISAVNSNVLITGDSGTGKSAIARYVHDRSPRHNEPFLEVNCAALPEGLIESELFGYTKGAFSGDSTKGKKGLIEVAGNGTLFLDEIGEVSLSLQAKLLRFIQNGLYFEVGGVKEKEAKCRIIAATNRDLGAMVKEHTFREDLYYRLKVFELWIPPLSQREEDIPALIKFFLDKYNEKYKLERELSDESHHLLCSYPWPGNVRELSNVLEQIVVMSPGNIILKNCFPKHIKQYYQERGGLFPSLSPSPVKVQEGEKGSDTFSERVTVSVSRDSYKQKFQRIQEESEDKMKELFTDLYHEVKSSRKIAKILGISESSAYRSLKKYCQELL